MTKRKKLRRGLIIAVSVLIVGGAMIDLIHGSRLSQLGIQKITDYMYSIECQNYSYEMAEEILNYGIVEPGCSAVRNGNIAGRNLDWALDEDAEFVVTTPGDDERYATLGVASLTGITDEFVDSGRYSILYEFMPFYTVDGINEKGLFISVNVVPTGDAGITTGTNPDGERMPNIILARYLLDYAASTEEAVALLSEKNIYAYEDVDGPFEIHLMVCDRENSIAIEFIDNQMVVCDACNVMTNFYMALEDYTEHAMGIERYDIIKANYESADTVEGMLELLKMVEYSRYYDADLSPRWYSESYGEVYTADGDVFGLSSDSADYEPVYLEEVEGFKSAKRDGSFWETTHSSVYDLEKLTLSLRVQEGDEVYTKVLTPMTDFYSQNQDNKDAKKTVAPMELVCLVMILFVLCGMLFENSVKDRKSDFFVYSLAALILGLLSDIIAWNYDGIASKVLEQTVSGYLAMVMSGIVAWLFILYEYEFIREREEKGRVFVVIASVLNGVSLLFLTVGTLLGRTFYFVDGVYHTQSWYYVSYVIGFVNMAIIVLMTLTCCRTLGTHDTVAFSMYVVIPLITTLIETFNPNLELGFVSISIAGLLVYIMLQSGKADELKLRQALMEELSYTDALTGLMNRRAYDEVLAKEPVGPAGVVFCDVNGLKYTNDTLGHKAGDELLIRFSTLLKAHFDLEMIYRISGDEFTVICSGVKGEAFGKAVDELRTEIATNGNIASVGSCFAEDERVFELLVCAEKDMYQDKAEFYKTHPQLDRRRK